MRKCKIHAAVTVDTVDLLEHYGVDKGYLMCEVDLFPQVAVKLT